MNLARFDLVTLDLFVAVARSGSISRGALQCHLAVAAASKRISDFEAHLGTALFYRHAAGVRLTEAGHVCFQHALSVLQDVERMSGALSDYAAGARGQVRIWANTSALTQFLPQDLGHFMSEHPAIRIEVEERNSATIVAAVRENRADLGIFAEDTPAEGLDLFEYRRDRLVLVMPREHPLASMKPLSLEAALDYDFVSLANATSIAQRLHAESNRLQKTLKLRIQVRSFDAACRMVKAGLGVSLLPQLAAQLYTRSLGLKLARLPEAWTERRLLLGVRRLGSLAAPARLLAKSLSAEAGRALDEAEPP